MGEHFDYNLSETEYNMSAGRNNYRSVQISVVDERIGYWYRYIGSNSTVPCARYIFWVYRYMNDHYIGVQYSTIYSSYRSIEFVSYIGIILH